jgi:hypothetical protein
MNFTPDLPHGEKKAIVDKLDEMFEESDISVGRKKSENVHSKKIKQGVLFDIPDDWESEDVSSETVGTAEREGVWDEFLDANPDDSSIEGGKAFDDYLQNASDKDGVSGKKVKPYRGIGNLTYFEINGKDLEGLRKGSENLVAKKEPKAKISPMKSDFRSGHLPDHVSLSASVSVSEPSVHEPTGFQFSEIWSYGAIFWALAVSDIVLTPTYYQFMSFTIPYYQYKYGLSYLEASTYSTFTPAWLIICVLGFCTFTQRCGYKPHLLCLSSILGFLSFLLMYCSSPTEENKFVLALIPVFTIGLYFGMYQSALWCSISMVIVKGKNSAVAFGIVNTLDNIALFAIPF